MTKKVCDLFYICIKYNYIKCITNPGKFLLTELHKKIVEAKYDQHIYFHCSKKTSWELELLLF